MSFSFREDKATEAAALFLELRGGRMHYLKLVKLMYLAERESLIRWGKPLTYDLLYSLDKGPVLSRTLELLTEESEPGEHSYWRERISLPVGDYEVELLKSDDTNYLSDAEEGLIREIFETHGHKNRWELVKELHGLPEYQFPNGSHLPISYRTILKNAQYSDEDIQLIDDEIECSQSFYRAGIR